MVLDIMEGDESLSCHYDSLLLLDVLEHIEDDSEFLMKCAELLKPGGYIIINVPAFIAFYSRYDKQVGHQRRYTKVSIARCVASAKLNLIESG